MNNSTFYKAIKYMFVAIVTYKISRWFEESSTKNNSKKPEEIPDRGTPTDFRGGNDSGRLLNLFNRVGKNIRQDPSIRAAIVAALFVALPDLFTESFQETIVRATPNLINQNFTKKEIESTGALVRLIYMLQLEVQNTEQQFNWETFQRINDPLNNLSWNEKKILIKETLAEAFSIDSSRKKAKLAMLIFFMVGFLLGSPGITSTPMFGGLVLQIYTLLKEGKLSKPLAKKIVKMLLERGQAVPQDLLDLINS